MPPLPPSLRAFVFRACALTALAASLAAGGARAQGGLLAPLCWGPQDPAHVSPRPSEVTDDTRSHGQYFWVGEGCTVEVHYRGPLALSDDGRRIARLGAGGRLTIEEQYGGAYRRLVVEPDAHGRPTYAWSSGGARSSDPAHATRAASEAWLARLLPELSRRSGLLASSAP